MGMKLRQKHSSKHVFHSLQNLQNCVVLSIMVWCIHLLYLVIARLLLEGSLSGDTSRRHLIFISISVSLISLFALLRGLSLWVVSKKSRQLGFCIRLSWAATLSFFTHIRHGSSRGSYLMSNGVRGREWWCSEVSPLHGFGMARYHNLCGSI